MKVLVVGLGSMGKRRIRLLKKIKPDFLIIGVDSNEERAELARKEYGIEICTDLSLALERYQPEYAVISTAPLSHAAIIRQCLSAGVHVFTEINLVNNQYTENMRLAEEQGKVLFLSSTFLYRDDVRYVIKKVGNHAGRVNYNYHVGQYLPDWHPWENFKNFFVGKKETNGCREIFAIDLPWIIEAFGDIEHVDVLSGKNTNLNIDYCDNYLLLIQHKTGHKGMVAVDIMSRKAVRKLEVFGEQLYITWDGTPKGLEEYDWEKKEDVSIDLYDEVDTLEGYSSFVIENAYESELRAFFDEVEKGVKPEYSFARDIVTLGWIDKIEGII